MGPGAGKAAAARLQEGGSPSIFSTEATWGRRWDQGTAAEGWSLWGRLALSPTSSQVLDAIRAGAPMNEEVATSLIHPELEATKDGRGNQDPKPAE